MRDLLIVGDARNELEPYLARREYDPEGLYFYGRALEGLGDIACARNVYSRPVEAARTAPHFRRRYTAKSERGPEATPQACLSIRSSRRLDREAYLSFTGNPSRPRIAAIQPTKCRDLCRSQGTDPARFLIGSAFGEGQGDIPAPDRLYCARTISEPKLRSGNVL